MRFDIITIFPEAFTSYLDTSILKRALGRGLISVKLHGLRKWGQGRHKQLDDKPYGGGAGMVLMAEPILRAIEKIKSIEKIQRTKTILLSAKGKQFNQKMAHDWSRRHDRLILISGRYEGIDERVRQILKADEVSVGPYVLTDGDAAAMVIISAVSRLIPGVIKLESLVEESHWSELIKHEAVPGRKGLEYPHYTRPEALRRKGKRYRVPKVLLSGDHKKIEEWRKRHVR